MKYIILILLFCLPAYSASMFEQLMKEFDQQVSSQTKICEFTCDLILKDYIKTVIELYGPSYPREPGDPGIEKGDPSIDGATKRTKKIYQKCIRTCRRQK